MKPCFGSTHQTRSAAFTLIEMLVVVTIIVLLLAFSTPALMRTMQATRVTSAGDALMGAISEAQQIAFAQNVPVEMRFFKYPDGLDTEMNFRSYQVFKITQQFEGDGSIDENPVPIGNVVRMTENVIIVPDASLSPILAPSSGDMQDTRQGSNIGYSGVTDARYNALRFMPDGTCRSVGVTTAGMAALTFNSLPQSFLTIASESGQPITADNLPKNFYTIQIDPFTGKARNYKPGF